MKRLLTTLMVLASLLGSGGAVWAQDFYKGSDAYISGDYATALKEFRPLADQGDAVAQNKLGLMYENGEGVTQDYAEAVKWYRKAAEQGFAWAQFNLGRMYDNGQGVTQDYAEAVKWYRKVAEQGYPLAQDNLGVMYFNGNGVLQDTIAAHMWFNIAAANGHPGAAKARDFAADELSSSDIVKAQQKAKRCMASGYKDCD
jgi:TPR repeat protein